MVLWRWAVSYERGTPVPPTLTPRPHRHFLLSDSREEIPHCPACFDVRVCNLVYCWGCLISVQLTIFQTHQLHVSPPAAVPPSSAIAGVKGNAPGSTFIPSALPPSGWLTILKLTFWVCSPSPSALEQVEPGLTILMSPDGWRQSWVGFTYALFHSCMKIIICASPSDG